ncbi:MAG: hypothetical protein ACQEVA_20445, partial [Myxococcota bacterium]
MSDKESKEATVDEIVSTGAALLICIGAIAAAAAPHFFLERPIEMYLNGQTGPWIGLVTWMPTFLAAVAIFCGVDFSNRADDPLVDSPDYGLAAAVLVPVLAAVGFAWLNFDGYEHVGSWAELGKAMAVYGVAYGVAPLFWQGFFQAYALEKVPAILRVFVVTLAGVAVWAPFGVVEGWGEVSGLLWEHVIIFAALALIFEFGVTVSVAMVSGVLIGVGWAFAHQMTF